jgi:MFS family permease
VIVAGIVILLVSMVFSGLSAADDVWTLGIGLFLLGLGWSCTLIAGSTLVTDEVEPRERPAVQGLSDLTMNVAGALGGVVAGLVVWVSSYAVLNLVSAIPVVALAIFAALPACRKHSNTRSM